MSTPVFHFTHLRNLASILRDGLRSDTEVQRTNALHTEVGNTSIKAQRRIRLVTVAPGGVVADYVPFYFAPRSPMMYSIHRSNVPTYQDGCDELVYVLSTVEKLTEAGCRLAFTDRNAALPYSLFAADMAKCDINWPLMGATMWNNTAEHPDRMERRMAECLAHQQIPVQAILGIVAKTRVVADEVTRLGGPQLEVRVRPDWYF